LKHLNWPVKRIALSIRKVNAGALRKQTSQRKSQSI
jgi:hypothetical protein